MERSILWKQAAAPTTGSRRSLDLLAASGARSATLQVRLADLQRRHAMTAMRGLMTGELGFNDLQRAVRAPSATTLARRLADPERLGLPASVWALLDPSATDDRRPAP